MRPLLLHAIHERLGAQPGEQAGHPVVLHYGDPEAEYRAALEGAALADLSARACIRCTGPDAEAFIQGMVTQDVRALSPSGAAPSALLTAKGAMVSDARVTRVEGGLLLDVEPGLAPNVVEFLSKYLISEDAELSEDAEVGWLGVYGPKGGSVLASAGGAGWEQPLPVGEGRKGLLFGVEVQAVGWNRLGVPGTELLVPLAGLSAVFEGLLAAGARGIGHEAMEILRVEAALPRFGIDMGPTTIPLEANLAASISYTKGCYIGQEVIARATYRGRMNRHLRLLDLGDSPAPPPKDAGLLAGDKRVGWITSVVRSWAHPGRWLALGYVHRDFEEAGTELSLEGALGKAKVLEAPLRAWPATA